MKGSLAACLGAVKALAESQVPLSGDVLLTAVADEEYLSIGTQTLVERYRADAAIVTEPTGLRPCVAHKGYAWLDVRVHGLAAHGSRFREGRDANLLMGRFLGRLEAFGQELIRRQPHALVGPPSLHVAKMWGGTEWSMYAAHSQVQIERRAIPGENLAGVQAEIQALLDQLATEDPGFNADLEAFLWREPFEVDPQAMVVQTLCQAAERVLPEPPALIGEAFWMDSAILSAAGIETVIFGPAGGGAHAAEEWVDLDSVIQTARVLAETARAYCT
jgi:acetylornithine deacetylase